MSFLTVINESGIPPHSTCLFEWGDSHPKVLKWYGFFPTSVSVFMWGAAVKGKVQSDARAHYITSYVRFEVPDSYLRLSQIMIDTDWKRSTYVFGIRDCVSMAAAIAKKCGLCVPIINMTPAGLVEILNMYNATTHYQPVVSAPYPWVAPPPPLTPEQLKEQKERESRWRMREQERWA